MPLDSLPQANKIRIEANPNLHFKQKDKRGQSQIKIPEINCITENSDEGKIKKVS